MRVSQEHCTKAEFGTGGKHGHEILLSANLLMFPWLAGGQTRKQVLSGIGQERFNSLGRDGGGLGPVDTSSPWCYGQVAALLLTFFLTQGSEWFWPCVIRNQKRQGRKKRLKHLLNAAVLRSQQRGSSVSKSLPHGPARAPGCSSLRDQAVSRGSVLDLCQEGQQGKPWKVVWIILVKFTVM